MCPMKDNANLYPPNDGEKVEPINKFARHDRSNGQAQNDVPASDKNVQRYPEPAPIIRRATGKENVKSIPERNSAAAV